MDKQTAIDLLDNLLGMVEDNHGSDYDKAIHMGIDALKMQLSIESTTFPVDGEPLDCISRQQAILCIERNAYRREDINETEKVILWVLDIIKWLPSVQPERMTNRQWVDFLCAQFDISRTSAKEMLHGMMRWKKEDNFKKLFNGGKT